MRDVAIIGVGMIKFGRYPEKTVPELAGQAALLALKDAGVDMKDIELLASGNLYQSNAMVGQRIMQTIGQTGIPVINVANACATGSTAFREAYFAVASGAYDMALAVGSEQMGKMGLLGGGGGGGDRAYSTEGVLGSGLMPAVFGMAGVEHMRKYGTTQEQFAKVSVKNHKHSMHNPYSQYQTEVGLEDVLNARVVSWPNTLYMCCPTGDGAAAAVLCIDGEGPPVHDEADPRRRLGAHVRPVDAARPDHARHQHPHPQRREGGLREGRHRPGGPRPRSSCTTASPRRRSCTTRTSASAARARPAA